MGVSCTRGLREGDFLFQNLEASTLGDAIEQVTEGHFSHCGMVVRVGRGGGGGRSGGDSRGGYSRGGGRLGEGALTGEGLGCGSRGGDSLAVVEAFGDSVQVTPLATFYARSAEGGVVAMRLKRKYRPLIPAAVAFALSQREVPYDHAYMLDNGRWYCSELLTEAFPLGLFPYQPMTFKDPGTGAFLPAWEAHYAQLGIPIPEGALGNNPNSLYAAKVWRSARYPSPKRATTLF